MRVEIRGQASSDVRAQADRGLRAGEVRRDGNDLRVGLATAGDADALRTAAAAAARSLRGSGGTIAWTLDGLRRSED